MTTERRFNPPPTPSTPENAPWTELQSLNRNVAELVNLIKSGIVSGQGPVNVTLPPDIQTLIRQNADIVNLIKGGTSGPVSASSLLKIIIDASGTNPAFYLRTFRDMPASANPYDTDVIDFSNGYLLQIHVESEFDQPLVLQPIGHVKNALRNRTNIGVALPLPAYGSTDIAITGGQWRRFVWLRSSVGVSPTRGNLTITYVIQG